MNLRSFIRDFVRRIAEFSTDQKQVLLFLVAGTLGACSELASFYVLHRRMGMMALAASTIATTVGILFNYLLSITLVFERGRHRAHVEFLAFLAVSALMLTLNQIVFVALMMLASQFPMLCKATSILLIAAISFLAKKRWVFAA